MLIALNSRNQRLAKFWLTDQAGAPPAPSLAGRTIAIVHGEDDFVNMLAHVFSVLGMGSRVVRHEALLADGADGAFDDVDLVVVGPGPGDPRDHDHPKIAAYRAADRRAPRLGQAVPRGVPGPPGALRPARDPADYKDIVFQGTQSSVEIDGREERVGFYNTFVGRARRGRAARRRTGRGRPGDRRHPPGGRADTTAASSSTPSRSSPRTGSPCSAACCWSCWGERSGAPPGCSWWTTTTPTPGTSCTWSPRSPATCRTSSSTTPRECSTAPRRSPTWCCPPARGIPQTLPTSPSGRRSSSSACRCSGVCLGMQALVTSYGGTVDRIEPAHGEVASVTHEGLGVLAGIPSPFDAVRYHSLAAVGCPTCSR